MQLSSIQKFVLSKVFNSAELKKVRKDLQVGNHHVDFTVRVVGDVTVGEDYERSATTSIPWLESVALLRETTKCAFQSLIDQIDSGKAITKDDLVSMKNTSPVSLSVLVSCIENAILNGKSAIGKVEESYLEVKDGIEEMKKNLIHKLPLQSCDGKVTVSASAGTFDPLENYVEIVEQKALSLEEISSCFVFSTLQETN